MKKILYSALALPLLFACSSEDFDNQAINNDPFAGIAKVDATFTMDEPTTRFDGGVWNTEEGDLWGFAWMGDGTVLATNTGNAYQNHNLIQTNGIFTPQTSIYVGSYYLYRPYDKTTVSPQAINFNSLVNQPLAEGYASTTQSWKDLAKTAINIGDVWTNVSVDGRTFDEDPTIWNKAGIKGENPEKYKIYAAMFSNQTGLDLTYVKNNPTFTAAKRIQGATDIDLTYAAGTEVGAADIYEATVNLNGAAKSFTYAPTASPNGAEANHSGTYWANKRGLGDDDGFTFTNGAITLTPEDAVNGISTGDNGSEGWFWFNSLPVTAGDGTLESTVVTTFNTSYGVVTVEKTVGACAWAFEKYNATATSPEWIQLAGADAAATATTDATWNLAGAHNTFINQYGNHKGKFKFDVDFSTGDLSAMHIKSDAHLQKLLKYYIASGKNDEVQLNLDGNEAHEFRLSKISIALLQTINAGGVKVTVKPCTTEAHTPTSIVITQEGQTGDLASATDVPDLNNVFATAVHVDLSHLYEWTWRVSRALQVDHVSSITLLNGQKGTLNVTSTNVELSDHNVPIYIAGSIAGRKDATMTINAVTTVKNPLTNRGTINVNAGAELRAYGVAITNDARSKTEFGTINNYGVVGVTYNTNGTFNNYGLIDMKIAAAITLLTTNQTEGATIDNEFSEGINPNKLGTVKLPAGQPNALVSVANAEETGFIEYEWTGGTTYSTPNNGVVKYNTLLVSDNIAFTTAETEIKYIKFSGSQKTVTNLAAANLPQLKGIIVTDNSSIIIEKNNILNCSAGSHLGQGATVYTGGTFNPGNTHIVDRVVTDYLGTWSTDQIVVWGQQVEPEPEPEPQPDDGVDVEP